MTKLIFLAGITLVLVWYWKSLLNIVCVRACKNVNIDLISTCNNLLLYNYSQTQLLCPNVFFLCCDVHISTWTPWTHINTSFIVWNWWLSFALHILWGLTPQLFMKTRVKCFWCLITLTSKPLVHSNDKPVSFSSANLHCQHKHPPVFLSLSIKKQAITGVIHTAFAKTSNKH